MIEGYRFKTIQEAYAFYGGIQLCALPEMEVLGMVRLEDNSFMVAVLNDLDAEAPFAGTPYQGEIPMKTIKLDLMPDLDIKELKQDDFFDQSDDNRDVPKDPEFDPAAETQEINLGEDVPSELDTDSRDSLPPFHEAHLRK